MPSIHAIQRHLINHHVERLSVRCYGDHSERFIAMSADELCRRRLQLSCRQGGRAEARRLLAENLRTEETSSPRPSSSPCRSAVWDEEIQLEFSSGRIMFQLATFLRRRRLYRHCRVLVSWTIRIFRKTQRENTGITTGAGVTCQSEVDVFRF